MIQRDLGKKVAAEPHAESVGRTPQQAPTGFQALVETFIEKQIRVWKASQETPRDSVGSLGELVKYFEKETAASTGTAKVLNCCQHRNTVRSARYLCDTYIVGHRCTTCGHWEAE